MRQAHIALASSLLAAAIVFACSHGNYDGTFVGDGGTAEGGDAGTVVLTKEISPANGEKLRTPDGALEITIVAGTFDGPTTLTVTRLADRAIDNNLIVPAYTITAPKEPQLPFQLAFTGNNPNPGSSTLVTARAGTDGVFVPTPLTGIAPIGPNGSTMTTWGAARNFGSFSLVFQPVDNAVYDVASDSCLAQCCTSQSMTGTFNGNIGSVGGSCFCSSNPNIECLLEKCQPNVAAALARCAEVTAAAAPPPGCRASATNLPPCSVGGACGYPMNGTCMNNQTCCIDRHAGQCLGGQGSPGSCTGIAIRCDLATACPNGTKCCVFETEAYCASSCPDERTWCSSPADCSDGGACNPAPNCPYGTCGTPPAGCTN